MGWNKAQITWESPKGYNPSKMMYKVTWHKNDNQDDERAFIVTDTFANITGLRQLSTYFVNIQAGNSAGFGPKLPRDLYVRTPGKTIFTVHTANVSKPIEKYFLDLRTIFLKKKSFPVLSDRNFILI